MAIAPRLVQNQHGGMPGDQNIFTPPVLAPPTLGVRTVVPGTIDAAVAYSIREVDGGENMRQILHAQKEACLNGASQEFWDNAMGENRMMIFAGMEPQCRFVQFYHSCGRFIWGFSTGTQLRGTEYAFQGDRDRYCNDPYAVQLPKDMGVMKKINYCDSLILMEAFIRAKETGKSLGYRGRGLHKLMPCSHCFLPCHVTSEGMVFDFWSTARH